jgi:rRNA maturation endonuclease Nob1
VSSTSGKVYWAKMCAECGELMPRSEKICYCGGPITIINVTVDEAKFSTYYHDRRRLFRLKGSSQE